MTMMEPKGPGGHSTRGSHRAAQAGTCERKWFFRWRRNLRPRVGPIYFLEGTLVHIALAYYRANQLHQRGLKAPLWFYEESMVDCLQREGIGYPDAVALGLSVFAAYHERYSSHDSWEPVAIEEEYKASLGQIRKYFDPAAAPRFDDHEVFTARIDIMIRTGGFLWACDYKTTKHQYKGRLNAFNYEGEFAVNWQFLVQTAILRVCLGTEFRGVVVERCLKSTPHDFERTVAPISDAMLKSVPEVLSKVAFIERHIVQQEEEARLGGADMDLWMPAPSPWACFSWGNACEYRQLCTNSSGQQLKESVVREYLGG